MKLKELLKGLEILSATADLETEIAQVQYDSRRVGAGDLFLVYPNEIIFKETEEAP